MRKLLVWATLALSLTVVPLAVAGSGMTVKPFQWTQGAKVVSISAPVVASGAKVSDQVVLMVDPAPPLVQGGFTLNRVYNPDTMRGTVTGVLGGSASQNYRGTLSGIIRPDGMSGLFQMKHTSDQWPGFYWIIGRWSSVGQPVAPSASNPKPLYPIQLDGVEIGPFTP
jgi:hypothetical protein